MATTLKRFESMGEYLAYAQSCGGITSQSQGRHWDGRISGVEAVEHAQKGMTSLVPTYADGLETLATDMNAGSRARTILSPVGSSVSVPSFLNGSPYAMRRRVRREETTRHVSIYVSTQCSADVSAENMIGRGTAILGMLEYLTSQQISVDLYLVAVTDIQSRNELIQVVKLETRPLDLSVTGFTIAHPAFSRHIMLESVAIKGHNSYGQWSPNHRTNSNGECTKEYINHVRAQLGLEPNDVYVPEVYSTDSAVCNPKQWMKDRISQIVNREAA